MRLHIVFRYVGLIILLNAAFLFISAGFSFHDKDSAFFPLVYTALISVLFGIFPIIFVPATEEISNKEGFSIVVSSWLISCVIGFIPYILWGGEFTLTNAWFESVSGFTTTGSSILTEPETLPKGLLFWRAATHWIGGVGIIIFALSVMPSMGKIGMVLYRAEISSLGVENFRYRTKKTLQIIMVIYVGLTVLETVALLLCGMNLFDSITHSFATIATGGFSTKNLSIAYFKSTAVETVIIIFMILSGINFGLLFITVAGDVRKVFTSTVVRFYLFALVVAVVLTTVNIHGTLFGSWSEAFRYAAFQIISIGTSTGFATTDTTLWPPLAQLLIIFFTLQCACSGSTSGGIKVDRIVLFWYAIKKRITKTEHPHAVIKVKIDNVAIEDEIVDAGVLYISLYIGIVFISSLLLALLGVDMLTAFSASSATMGNVGPGFGLVGSMSNFSQIPELGKWVLSADMLLGRLEIFGVFLFVALRSWR